MVHALQFAMPNEFGSDHLPETRPLVRVVWSNQFPFGVLGTHGGLWRHERQAPAARHRVVFAIGKRLFGAKAYDVRGGYRYRTWHWRGVAGFAGLGMAYDNNAGPWRAALSPELGLHVGRPRLFFPGFQLRVQGDLYTSAPHAHGLVTVGYTFM